MKRIFTLGAAAALALCLGFSAQAQEQRKYSHSDTVTVVSVDAEAHTVTVRDRIKGDYTVKIDQTTKIRGGEGDTIALAALTEGTRVAIDARKETPEPEGKPFIADRIQVVIGEPEEGER